MLSWLDRFWRSASGYVDDKVRSTVHWAEHAIMGVVLNVFGLVGTAWRYAQQGWAAGWAELGSLAHSVWAKFQYVLHVLIPELGRWVSSQVARLLAFAQGIWSGLLRLISAVDARLTAAFTAAIAWVLRTVWAPLKAYADQIWHDLTKWGYTAWWLVTHPDQLAELLIFHIVASLEAHAWQVARLLGTFTLALIRANLRRIAQLAEDVITAVL